MKRNATTSSATNPHRRNQDHSATFAKALDGRKQPIRGLWVRNGRYYARLAVEDTNTGIRAVRRVPLRDADSNAVQTVAQAVTALARLRTQRADDNLPQLGQTPLFSTYADAYLDYVKSGNVTKKNGTISKEKGTLKLWKSHLGHLRLDKIKPAHVSAFVQKRLKEKMTRRTAKLDVIILRNVLKRARDVDQHIKTLPIPPGLNAELKSISPKRPLFPTTRVRQISCTLVGGKLHSFRKNHHVAIW